jgi:hypothetical protein
MTEADDKQVEEITNDKFNKDKQPPEREGYKAKFGKNGWTYTKVLTETDLQKRREAQRKYKAK